jgi:hypothetical protein
MNSSWRTNNLYIIGTKRVMLKGETLFLFQLIYNNNIVSIVVNIIFNKFGRLIIDQLKFLKYVSESARKATG